MATTNAAWGIEVGQFALKAMRLVADGDSVAVTDFTVIPHQRVLSDPAVTDQAGMVRVTLASFVQQFGERLGADKIVMSLPGNAGFARFTTLPGVDPKSLKSMVEYEAKQQIPFPMEDVEWDSHVLPPDEIGQCGIGIFAVTKDRLRDLLSQYAECGIEPDVLTLSPIAAYNAINYDLNLNADSTAITCVDIGTTSSDFIVIDRGRCWIRTFPVGGTHFTSAISDAFAAQGLTYARAEKIKVDRAPKEDVLRARTTAMRGVTAQLVDEIGRSREFYQDANEGIEIKSAYGIGSTLKISGLRTKIAGDLKFDLRRLEEFKRIEVHGPDPADFAANSINLLTAYGLALQGIGLAKVQINLAPIGRVREKVWRAKTPWFVAAAALICLASGAMFLRVLLDGSGLGSLADKAAQADTVIKQGRALVSQLQEVQTLTGDDAATNLTNLLEDRRVWPYLLHDTYSALAAARPSADELSGDVEKIRAIPAENRRLVHLENFTGRPKFDPATNKRQIEVAVRITLTNQNNTKLINDADGVLGWLRKNKDRPEAPYVIEEDSLVVPNWTKIVAGKREEPSNSNQDGSGSAGGTDYPAQGGTRQNTGVGGGGFAGRRKNTGTVQGPGSGGSLSGAGGGGESNDSSTGDTSGDSGDGTDAPRRAKRTVVAGVDEKLPTLDLTKVAPLPSVIDVRVLEEKDVQYEGILTFTVTLRSTGPAAPTDSSGETPQ